MVYEHSALTAVLLGQTGEPAGPAPTEEEMAAWAARRLSGKRLSEVESHIAHDPVVFARAMQHWRDRVVARPSLFARIAELAQRWRPGPLPAFAAGVATIGLVALLALHLRAPVELPASTPVLRGAEQSSSDWRVVAFRAGYWQEQAAVAATRAGDRADTFGCVDGEGCGAQVRQLVRFGELLAHLNAACQSGLDAGKRTALVTELGAIDAGMADSLELLPWRGYVRELTADLATGTSGACDRAEALRALLVAE